jgi:hypothetical protein
MRLAFNGNVEYYLLLVLVLVLVLNVYWMMACSVRLCGVTVSLRVARCFLPNVVYR